MILLRFLKQENKNKKIERDNFIYRIIPILILVGNKFINEKIE
jgi:hypothetical protein